MPRRSDTDPKNLDAPTPKSDRSSDIAPILPDITLSQLLTLGIDDLAQKLNVPASKLNTMTLVELTTYLNDFIEKSKQNQVNAETPNDSPVFKVNFDDAVFEAKFDDTFGSEMMSAKSRDESSFIANFDNFNQAPVSIIPTADRYAVFREIIDQDILQQESIESNNSNSTEEVPENSGSFDFANRFESPSETQFKQSPLTVSQPANKISEALSGVKDRYQALRELRNIVLVEDLFDKSSLPPLASISDSNLSDEIVEDNSSGNQQMYETAEIGDNSLEDNIPVYGVSWADAEETVPEIPSDQTQITQEQEEEETSGTGFKDDLEIDKYMNKAISKLSLDQRLSPNIQAKTPVKDESGMQLEESPVEPNQKLSVTKSNEMLASPNKSPSLIDTPIEKEVISTVPKEIEREAVEIDVRGNFSHKI